MAVINQAKADGSWTILDPVEALEVPPDLAAAFTANPSVAERYEALGVGGKKQVLWSVVSAKRAETRAARISRIVERADMANRRLKGAAPRASCVIYYELALAAMKAA